MALDAEKRMLSELKKGRHPSPSDLGLGKEEFVALVSKALERGLIEGVYVSFCDSQSADGLLSSASLTEKGMEAAGSVRRFSLFRRRTD